MPTDLKFHFNLVDKLFVFDGDCMLRTESLENGIFSGFNTILACRLKKQNSLEGKSIKKNRNDNYKNGNHHHYCSRQINSSESREKSSVRVITHYLAVECHFRNFNPYYVTDMILNLILSNEFSIDIEIDIKKQEI